MTVKELKEVLGTLADTVEVCYSNYGNIPVNGYYTTAKNDSLILVLTDLYVQPRNA